MQNPQQLAQMKQHSMVDFGHVLSHNLNTIQQNNESHVFIVVICGHTLKKVSDSGAEQFTER